MGDAAARMAARLEVVKLAHVLDLDPAALEFLTDQHAATLRSFRADIGEHLLARHQQRFERVAAISSLVPAAVSARAAQAALGPAVSARVAGVLDPTDAVKLADRLPAEFLAELTLSLDPDRAEEIIRRLDPSLIVAVGRILVEERHLLVLSRFVSVVDPSTALELVADADPATLLEVAILADDRAALSELISGLEVDQVVAVLLHCEQQGRHHEALALLAGLDASAAELVVAVLVAATERVSARFLDAVREVGAWPHLMTALTRVSDAHLRQLVNDAATLDPALVDEMVRAAHEADQGGALVRLLAAVGAAHRDAVEQSTALRDPTMRAWLRANEGASALPRAVLDALAALDAPT